jgi:hypothetical protein
MGKKQEFLIFFPFSTKNHIGLASVPLPHRITTCSYHLVRRLLGGKNSIGKAGRFPGSRIGPLPVARPKTKKTKVGQTGRK